MKIHLKRIYKELLFQLFISILLIVLITFDQYRPRFDWVEVIFVFNYFLMALFINYYLLPHFYYKRKYLPFIIGFIAACSFVIITEEFVLEQIFYPISRGSHFDLIHTVLDIVPFIFILVASKFVWDATVNQNKVEHLNRMIAESKLEYLKQQINPHFLFNNLNNLYSYAIENSPKTPEIILELSSLLRYMLYDCKDKQVSLDKELEHLNSFIKLNELQLEGKGNVDYQTKVEMNSYIAPMILIVFVENAFKYSLGTQAEEIEILIKIEVSKGILYFHCSNTYDESIELNNMVGGIGLKNVQTRLDLLYPNAYQLETLRLPNKHQINLSIHLHQLQR